jgi:hypothetical protein
LQKTKKFEKKKKKKKKIGLPRAWLHRMTLVFPGEVDPITDLSHPVNEETGNWEIFQEHAPRKTCGMTCSYQFTLKIQTPRPPLRDALDANGVSAWLPRGLEKPMVIKYLILFVFSFF